MTWTWTWTGIRTAAVGNRLLTDIQVQLILEASLRLKGHSLQFSLGQSIKMNFFLGFN